MFEFVRDFGGGGTDNVEDITVDVAGNIYTLASFTDAIDCDPGSPVAFFDASGSQDLIVTMFDPSGTFVWAHQLMGTAGIVTGQSIVTDDFGSVYVCGSFNGIIDLDPGASGFGFTTNGMEDVFYCKLNAGGIFLWGKQIGANLSDIGVSVDLIGMPVELVITGNFSGLVDFDPDA